MTIRAPLRWRVQPGLASAGAIGLNYANPLTVGLRLATLFGRESRNLVDNTRPTWNGGIPEFSVTRLSPTSYGYFHKFNNSEYLQWPSAIKWLANTSEPLTVAWQEMHYGSIPTYFGLCNFDPGLSFIIFRSPSDATYYFSIGGGAQKAWGSNAAPVAGEMVTYVLTGAGGTNSSTSGDWILYKNGVSIGNPTGGTSLGNPALPNAIGYAGANDKYRAWVGNFCLWNRVLSAAEARGYYDNPYQLIRPQSSRVYVAVGGGGGTTGTLAVTEAADTCSASGTTEILGTVAVTEAADTMTASGTTTVLGTVAVTEAADTMSASGGSAVEGSLAVTEAADTMSASGTTTVTGTLAVTEASDSPSASGTSEVAGTMAVTEAADTMSASGAVGDSVEGSVAVTEAADTMTASGTTTVLGTVAVTEAADTMSASGTSEVAGTVAVTEAADTMTASGVAGSVSGSMAITEASDTMSATGVVGDVQNFPDEPFFRRTVRVTATPRIGPARATIERPFE